MQISPLGAPRPSMVLMMMQHRGGSTSYNLVPAEVYVLLGAELRRDWQTVEQITQWAVYHWHEIKYCYER